MFYPDSESIQIFNKCSMIVSNKSKSCLFFYKFYFHCSTQEQLPLLQYSSLGRYHFTVAAATHTILNTLLPSLLKGAAPYIYLKLLQATSATTLMNKIQVNNKAGNCV